MLGISSIFFGFHYELVNFRNLILSSSQLKCNLSPKQKFILDHIYSLTIRMTDWELFAFTIDFDGFWISLNNNYLTYYFNFIPLKGFRFRFIKELLVAWRILNILSFNNVFYSIWIVLDENKKILLILN